MIRTFGRQALAGLRLLLVLTLLTGVLYPAVVLGVGQGLLRHQANGSLLEHRGAVVGSALVGQAFTGPQWFHPRPSAAGSGYDAMAGGGSNLGPQDPRLLAQVQARRAAAAAADGVAPGAVPPDALTASASGLDPHVSPAYAAQQVPRVARERGLPEATVADLVRAHTQGRELGFLGQSRVDVLELNLALAARGGG